MIPMHQITGRLGNQMFQYAFFYTYAREHGIDHYYQDPKFFEDRKDEILQIFREGIGEPVDMVAIHVRRGDYVNNPFYVDLMSTNYYEEAMLLFPDKKFVVFSDDIEWCRQQPIFSDCEFAHGSEVDDMNDMASCVGHIIANSSFSWWAAYISPYTKKVVAPSVDNWHPDGVERTVCPPEWIRL